MKFVIGVLLSLFLTAATPGSVFAQTVQSIGPDPMTGELYACAAYNPKSKNNIVVTNAKGKKKTLKISVAKARIADHLADAKSRLRQVNKARRERQKELDALLNSIKGPLLVVRVNKLTQEIKKLDAKIAELTSNVALLAQLKKLIVDCKEALPVNGSLRIFTGIIPPGVSGAGYYYAFVVYVVSPNVADSYCAWIENPGKEPVRGNISVHSNVCAKYGIPECFDPTKDAGFMAQNKLGPNRAGTCKPDEVCNLSSAIAWANDYVSKFKIYDVQPAPSKSSKCD